VAHLDREELRAEPTLALAGGEDLIAQVRREGGDGRASGVGCRCQPGDDRGDGRIGRGGRLGGGEGVADELADPGELLQGGLGLESPDRAPGVPDERLPRGVQDGRKALEATRCRRQSVGQRREFASGEGEQAIADQVDPLERVPGVLAQLGVREATPLRARR